jgi:hypothetical protein
MEHTIRYIPLLKETFTFPQSLGILGGKPGASTYIAGVQDDRALYLDPHETQLVKYDFQFFRTYIYPSHKCCRLVVLYLQRLSKLIYLIYESTLHPPIQRNSSVFNACCHHY